MSDSSPLLRVTVHGMFSHAPGIPDRKTGYPSAMTPFTPDLSASFNGATDDDRASIYFVQLCILYINIQNCQHFKSVKMLFVRNAIFVLMRNLFFKSYLLKKLLLCRSLWYNHILYRPNGIHCLFLTERRFADAGENSLTRLFTCSGLFNCASGAYAHP